MAGPSLQDMAKTYAGVDATGRLADHDLRRRLTEHLMEAQAFALTGRRTALEARSNSGPSATSSVLKNVGSKVRIERAELSVEALGHQGLGWAGQGFEDFETAIPKAMLRSKAGAIAGGSWEVQLNIIAKRILGLPEATKAR